MKQHDHHFENHPDFPGLNVNQGVEQPPQVSMESVNRFLQKRKKKMPASWYVDGILKGDIPVLSKAVTLVESSRAEHQSLASEIISCCLPHSGNSIRIGITGVPGAGKSTFIEAMGGYITRKGHKLAVLAIDPSSERSKGSILGDKIRMEELAGDRNAYIRPSPSAGSLGGVARKTRETVILCEAAGFNTVFIETVGVGQSETAVHSMTDFFLLLMLAGAGDELQGIKRGITEMADMIVINKADGSNREKAELARSQFASAIHLYPFKESGWNPVVTTCSSIEKTGIPEVWDHIMNFCRNTRDNGYFNQNRNQQSRFWMFETINEKLKQSFYRDPDIEPMLADMEERVIHAELSPFEAASRLLENYFNKIV